MTEERIVVPPPPRLTPPPSVLGPRAWLRQNLFPTWYDSLLTVVLGTVLLLFTLASLRWILEDARWGVVADNLRLFLIGQYPLTDAWRVWVPLAILSLLAGLTAARAGGAVRSLAASLAAGELLLGLLIVASPLGLPVAAAVAGCAAIVAGGFIAGVRVEVSRRVLAAAWVGLVVAAFVLLQGIAASPLTTVSTNEWGGLLLTFLLAVGGIVLSFPLGVLLALGRRSDLRAVRWLSTAYIEVIRGVPLVTILFMAAIMLPLFLPGDVRIDRLFRALGGITLFSAAYVAENVRGGLQGIPSGQLEAAHAIGLSTIQTNRYIVLPQALRAVIPANVGLFISLLKDTTLVTIAVGLLELLGIGRAVLAQPEWFGAHIEVFLFISAVFFVMCYAISRASYRLEASLGVGTR